MSETDRNSNQTRQEKLFNNFVDVLNECVTPDPDTGKPVSPGAAMLNVIRQFLKDQNISADEDKHQGLKRLGENSRKLPFDDRPTEDQ